MAVEWLRDLWRLWILWRLWHLRAKPESFDDFGVRRSGFEGGSGVRFWDHATGRTGLLGGFSIAELGFGIGLAWFEVGFEVETGMVDCACSL
jgi:hypothetical protein